MSVLSVILFQRSEAELRGSIMKEEVNSFIMECNSTPSSLIGNCMQISKSCLQGSKKNLYYRNRRNEKHREQSRKIQSKGSNK